MRSSSSPFLLPPTLTSALALLVKKPHDNSTNTHPPSGGFPPRLDVGMHGNKKTTTSHQNKTTHNGIVSHGFVTFFFSLAAFVCCVFLFFPQVKKRRYKQFSPSLFSHSSLRDFMKTRTLVRIPTPRKVPVREDGPIKNKDPRREETGGNECR